jgi:hypothetical protein
VVKKKTAVKYCQQPDRDEPKLRCGYPLPCPQHTVVIDMSSTPHKTTIPLQSSAQTVVGRFRLRQIEKALQ